MSIELTKTDRETIREVALTANLGCADLFAAVEAWGAARVAEALRDAAKNMYWWADREHLRDLADEFDPQATPSEEDA